MSSQTRQTEILLHVDLPNELLLVKNLFLYILFSLYLCKTITRMSTIKTHPNNKPEHQADVFNVLIDTEQQFS